MWSVARRPKWIAALVLALVIAGLFAALGQWQLARSIDSGTVVERATETVRPLEEVAEPQQPTTDAANGQLVTVDGEFVPGDFSILSGRLNDGETGFWVVGRFQVEVPTGESPAALAVALGWAPTWDAAEAVADDLPGGPATVSGRYLSGESPQQTDFEAGEQSVLAPPALINEWADFDGDVYGGYVVSAEAVDGLDTIDSPVPADTVSLNWLNIFYAAEWVVFAGFAIFMWYRLVRDAWEREVELAEEEAAADATAAR